MIYDFIFLHAAEGILVIDSNSTVLHINPAAAAMLEIDINDCVGQPVESVFGDYAGLVHLLTIPGRYSADVRLPKERLAAGIAADMNDGQRVAILNDITEGRELDSRRESLVRAIAHDLRNPLNALGGYADLVRKMGDLNPQQEKFIGRIEQTTSKLYELASKLIDLAWIEAGMPLEYRPVEIASLTREVVNELAYNAQKNGVTIIRSIPDALPDVMGDPKRLKQVLWNLVDNAIRYSVDGGNVMIHAWHQGDDVYYLVADKGIGISADERDKIWDRMWRSNDERVRNIPGGGIGLSFAHTIIKRHGGTISAESEPDNGTTLTFRLPLTRGI